MVQDVYVPLTGISLYYLSYNVPFIEEDIL